MLCVPQGEVKKEAGTQGRHPVPAKLAPGATGLPLEAASNDSSPTRQVNPADLKPRASSPVTGGGALPGMSTSDGRGSDAGGDDEKDEDSDDNGDDNGYHPVDPFKSHVLDKAHWKGLTSQEREDAIYELTPKPYVVNRVPVNTVPYHACPTAMYKGSPSPLPRMAQYKDDSQEDKIVWRPRRVWVLVDDVTGLDDAVKVTAKYVMYRPGQILFYRFSSSKTGDVTYSQLDDFFAGDEDAIADARESMDTIDQVIVLLDSGVVINMETDLFHHCVRMEIPEEKMGVGEFELQGLVPGSVYAKLPDRANTLVASAHADWKKRLYEGRNRNNGKDILSQFCGEDVVYPGCEEDGEDHERCASFTAALVVVKGDFKYQLKTETGPIQFHHCEDEVSKSGRGKGKTPFMLRGGKGKGKAIYIPDVPRGKSEGFLNWPGVAKYRTRALVLPMSLESSDFDRDPEWLDPNTLHPVEVIQRDEEE